MQIETDIKIISVVIRARNAAEDLERCLMQLKKQFLPKGLSLELIVVDNESTDDTALIALQYGALVITITAEEFTWGRALNMGILKSTGQIVLLLSADAYPADEWLISEMIKPFEDTSVVAVYGRQLPRKDAYLDERVRLAEKFSDKSQRFDINNCTASSDGRGMIVSNACAAIRKSMWQNLKYDEQIEGGEEGVWTYEVLKAGFAYVYQASAKVFHSHNDHIFRFAWRELEIMQKNLRLNGYSMGLIELCHLIASFAKRRLLNCSRMNMPMRIKISAIIRMPLEMISFCIAFALANTRFRYKLRALMWK